MKYKWVIMKENETTHVAVPYMIVNTVYDAEWECYWAEQDGKNKGYIFWYEICKEKE